MTFTCSHVLVIELYTSNWFECSFPLQASYRLKANFYLPALYKTICKQYHW